jgi:hypothetical protein
VNLEIFLRDPKPDRPRPLTPDRDFDEGRKFPALEPSKPWDDPRDRPAPNRPDDDQ